MTTIDSSGFPEAIARPSPNHDSRSGRPISLVVLHYTGMASLEDAIARLTDPAPKAGRYPGPWQAPDIDPETPLSRVSAHYVVGENGAVFQLVQEDRRGWHAGVSHWAGQDGVNDISIGIEIANGGHDFALPPFPDAQLAGVIGLLRSILDRHGLASEAVVGHSDVAPGRKLDPGELFPWARLGAAGLALWPSTPAPADPRVIARLGDSGETVLAIQESLAAIGYGVAQSGDFDAATATVVTAFQRRFRPARMDGAFDQACAFIAADLCTQLAKRRLAKSKRGA